MLKTQKAAQEEDSKEAKAALRDAQLEVDALMVERKEIEQQWNESNNGVSKRNEALTTMQQSVRAQRQAAYAKATEVEAAKKAVLKEQETAEILSDRFTRVNNEVRAPRGLLFLFCSAAGLMRCLLAIFPEQLQEMKRKTQEVLERHNKAKTQYSFFVNSLQEAENNLTRLNAEFVPPHPLSLPCPLCCSLPPFPSPAPRSGV